MAGSAMAFADSEIAIHQVLGVVPTASGRQRHAADPRLTSKRTRAVRSP